MKLRILATTAILNKLYRPSGTENRVNSAYTLKVLISSVGVLAVSSLIQLPAFSQSYPPVPTTTTTSCTTNKNGTVCQQIRHPVGATVTTTSLPSNSNSAPTICQQSTYPPGTIPGFIRCTTNQNGTNYQSIYPPGTTPDFIRCTTNQNSTSYQSSYPPRSTTIVTSPTSNPNGTRCQQITP